MPKKSKRQARKTNTAVVKAAPASVQVVTTPSTTQATVGPTRLTTAAEFNPDYTYVRKDLRRIAILASSFIVVLIALSFFLK
jgi:hypothetical protein